jgi:tRNA(Arg) A34 adenosine deaminase TadA
VPSRLQAQIDLKQVEQCLWNLSSLKKLRSGDKVAFITYGETTYYSTYSLQKPELITVSAPVRLIQGIYEVHSDQAHTILRNRIFTDSTLTEMCHGMIRVAAKRVTGGLRATDHGIPISKQYLAKETVEITGGNLSSQSSPILQLNVLQSLIQDFAPHSAPLTQNLHMRFMKIAINLRERMPRHPGPRYLSDRPIAAILVSGTHQILAWATNNSSKNKTLHAELNLIRSFQSKIGGQLPRDSRIYTTLKPCKMCAGMIWTAAEDIRSITVYFLEDDSGPYAKFTVLNPGTHERLRATSDFELRKLQLEIQVL